VSFATVGRAESGYIVTDGMLESSASVCSTKALRQIKARKSLTGQCCADMTERIR
jgi:hypothetical protein